MQVHEVVIGECPNDPIAPTATGAELIIATAADRAECAAAAGRGLRGRESTDVCVALEVVIDVPQAVTAAAIDIAAGPAWRRRRGWRGRLVDRPAEVGRVGRTNRSDDQDTGGEKLLHC